MTNRKTVAAFAIILALTLALPVVVGAKKPPAFQATHEAQIVGETLSAVDVLVEQQKSGVNFHTNPYWVTFPLEIGEGFFVDCPDCPPAGTYCAFFSLTEFNRDGVWTMYIMIYDGDLDLRLEAVGTLDQVKKMKPFTFFPSESLIDVYEPATSIGVLIGHADPNFVISGEPLD